MYCEVSCTIFLQLFIILQDSSTVDQTLRINRNTDNFRDLFLELRYSGLKQNPQNKIQTCDSYR